MAITNLYSLLNNPWYIDRTYAEGFIPLLFNIMEGRLTIKGTPFSDKVFMVDATGNQMAFGESASDDRKYVGILSIKNPIYKYNQECGPRGSKSNMRIMDSFKSDDSIVAVVLDMDTGGGQSYGTPEFHDYVLNFPKPVVTYTDGLLCSAGYYIGSAASHIVANKRAEAIGSIGAYSQILDLEGYYAKQGAKLHTIYATKSTEKNIGYREALKGNYDLYIKQELDPLVETFHTDMKAARPNLSQDVFAGGTWGADDSLKYGLIDEIGTLQTAIDKAFALSNTNSNPNTDDMSKSKNRTNLQSVLGYEDPLAVTDNGSFLNEAELDAIETHLTSHQSALDAAATEKQTAVDSLATANTNAATISTALDNALASAEIEVAENATDAEKITALTNHIAELGKDPGDEHSNPPASGEEDGKHTYLNLETSIYKN